jgi:hypothetical protein
VTARLILVLLITLCCVANAAVAQETKLATQRTTAPKWQNGPPADERYFPIAVWLQDPKNAARYKAAGINLCVGLRR